MRARTAFSVLSVLVLLAVAAPNVRAEPPVVYVYPFLDGETFTAHVGDDIHLFWAWVALTKGQVRVFLNHASQTYTLTPSGEEEPLLFIPNEVAEGYWGPIQRVPADVDCGSPNLAFALWDYQLPVLEEGTYTLVFTQAFDQPVNDGFHTCIDPDTGEPFTPPPSLSRGTSVFTTYLVIEGP